jgi:two-component system, NarL family, response regulator LiaR
MKQARDSQKTIRVLIADDHPLMREALKAAIGDEPDMQVVGEATNGAVAVEQALVLKPDVIVMDLFMPVKSGLVAIAEIRADDPHAQILALTSSTDEALVLSAVQAGALGYLLKESPRTELLQAIREVSRGNSFLPPVVANKLAKILRQNPKADASEPIEPLTERETQVLGLIGDGALNREIAQKLGVSEGTIRTHVHNILGKLGLANRNQAIVYALREKSSDHSEQP